MFPLRMWLLLPGDRWLTHAIAWPEPAVPS